MKIDRKRIAAWRNDLTVFVKDNFNVEPDEWQKDGLKYLSGNNDPRKRLVFKSCTGAGKSSLLSWIGWHRLSCFADIGEHPKGAALSGEGRDNLRDNLWAELSKWRERSLFLKTVFEMNNDRIYAIDHPDTWFLSARSYPKDANLEQIGTALSGLHSKYPFILLDETGKMPMQIGQKAEQIFTGGCENGLIAQAGNPTSLSGLLYHSSTHDRDRSHVITITADPDDPKRTPRVDIEHAREQIKKYGRDNPWVKATILGEFPDGDINVLLSVNEVEQAMSRRLNEDAFRFAQRRIGVDVARFGLDSTVFFPRQGLKAYMPIEMKGARTNEIADRLVMAKRKWDSEIEFVDDTGGFGAGVIDTMIQYGHSPVGVSFSSKSSDEKYFNKRSEMWFEMAEWVKRGGSLPNLPELLQDLTTPQYSFQGGKFRIEEKDQIKKRLGRSPDLADALALTFAQPDMPGKMNLTYSLHSSSGNKSVKRDWDPYS